MGDKDVNEGGGWGMKGNKTRDGTFADQREDVK